MKWHTEKRKINDLIPYEKNPRQMTGKQNEDLKKSLEKFDLVEIPAINTNNKIISGHQRLRILQQLGKGEEEIDVRVPDRELNEEEFKEYLIRANKNLGEWNFDELANNFDTDELLDWGFDQNEYKGLLGLMPEDSDWAKTFEKDTFILKTDEIKLVIEKLKTFDHDNKNKALLMALELYDSKTNNEE